MWVLTSAQLVFFVTWMRAGTWELSVKFVFGAITQKSEHKHTADHVKMSQNLFSRGIVHRSSEIELSPILHHVRNPSTANMIPALLLFSDGDVF